MIRLIQRRLIIPRGDTGSFSIPVLRDSTDNIAVFTIFDEVTQTKIFQKKVKSEGGIINIAFTHADTVNLKPGEYVWDIKYYSNPEYLDDELVNGEEIDSYYAGFSLPVCEIRETADNYLVSPEAPTATLSPQQLEIVTGAIHSLNEAIRKTQENVEHYPEIRDEVWYVWDAEQGDYVSTDVRANGIVGNGIASAVLNDDYTLTLNFTDGTSFTSTSIRGQRGNGIEDIVLNNDFTLTITYTDGDSYITPSIRGPVGATPQFSIGTVQDGAAAAASITGTAENPVLNLTLPNAHVPTRVSQLENDSNYAVDANYVHTDNNYTTAEKNKLSGIAAGAEVNVNADWNAISGDAQILNKPTKVSDFTNDAGYLTEHQDISGKADKSEIPTKVSQLQNDSGYLTSFTETDPTVPAWAKAAQKPLYTAAEVGAPTVAEMNTAIGEAVGQLNSFDIAVVQTLPTQDISTHTIYLVPKTGETNDVYDEYIYINSNWEMIGNTQIDLSNYATKDELPDVPVQDVQINGVSVLQDGVANMPIASESNLGVVKVNNLYGIAVNPATGTILTRSAGIQQIKESTDWYRPVTPYYQHNSVFYGLAKAAGDTTQSQSDNAVGQYTDEAKTAIQTMLDVPSTSDIPNVPVQDVQINGTSILQNGVANVPMASDHLGVVKANVYGNYGILIEDGEMLIVPASENAIKGGANGNKPISPIRQHSAVFYGLAKAAGADMKNIANTTVGVYPDAQKEAIQSMLGVSQMLAPENPNLVATQAYAIGDIFTANGKLYKATAAIAADAAIIPEVEGEEIAGANCVETSLSNGFVKKTDYATFNDYGIVKIGNGLTFSSSTGKLQINSAGTGTVKVGGDSTAPIVSAHQHESTFYGLAKAAGADEKNSTLPVGQYTDTAKSAIRSMIGATSSNVIAVQDTQPTDTDTKIWLPETAETPVEVPTVAEMNAALSEKVGDVQVNGTSVVSNSIANIPIMATDVAGVAKKGTGLTIDAQNKLSVVTAIESNIKTGTTSAHMLTPARQHIATFYGLAKAAGDTTQSQSDNAVGTYTNEAKTAINNMIGSVSKESLENAGITSKTYSTKFGGEFSVTTATTSGWLNPYARASVTGRINKENMHRVTFNGTEYVLRTRLWYDTSSGLKVYEYLGNLGLYIEDIAGVPGGTDNVPFIIISDLNNSNSIDVITQTAGTYTILVEQINPTKVNLPKSLIWGDSYVPIEKNNNGGTYNGFSFGVNELNNKRGTFGFGYGNKIENEFSLAFGRLNNITMPGSTAIGIKNNITGSNGIAIGENNNITSSDGVAIGDSLNVNSLMTAVGKNNVPANTVFPNWANNTQYHKGDMVYAVWNPSESATSPILLWVCIVDHISPSSGTFFNTNPADNRSWTLAPTTGDTAFVVGNGNNITSSNAMKVDWLGNTYVGGNLYVNCDSDSTNGTKVATVNDILVNDVQINGSSIVSNGIASIPIATLSDFGLVKIGNGLQISTSTQKLMTLPASSSAIKIGTETFNQITPYTQHESVFYGLAKAASDTTQSASSNAVGTYTDEAKSAIQTMLGIDLSSIASQVEIPLVETVTGAAVTITGQPNTRYMCGEVTSISITPPAAGSIDVVFTSGSTVAVLTLPSTVKMPEWFDATTLDTNTTYEILITDGVYGSVMTWQA